MIIQRTHLSDAFHLGWSCDQAVCPFIPSLYLPLSQSEKNELVRSKIYWNATVPNPAKQKNLQMIESTWNQSLLLIPPKYTPKKHSEQIASLSFSEMLSPLESWNEL